jgi:hypothetical protein
VFGNESQSDNTEQHSRDINTGQGVKVEAEEMLADAVVEVSQVTAEQPRQSIRVYIPGWYSGPRRRSW